MSIKSFAFLAAAAAVLPFVSAHGDVFSVTANGKTINALNPYNAKGSSAVRVMYKNSLPEAFVDPSGFHDNSKFSCEGSSHAPAAQHLTVSAGGTVTITWQGATSELLHQPGAGNTGNLNPWTHATGPILDYLTDCLGDCTKFDATNAGWTKIQAEGIDLSKSISSELRNTMAHKGGVGEPYYPTGAGVWAAAKMIAQDSKWFVTIPKNLKGGNYMLRHEVSAMHSPGAPQNYIACIQLDVINGGSATLPAGTQAKDLYDTNSASYVKYNIYSAKPQDFKTPGPALWDGASGAPANPPTTPTPPSNPAPPANSPSNPPSNPAPGKQCKQRKRAEPASPAAKRNHRKRLGAEH